MEEEGDIDELEGEIVADDVPESGPIKVGVVGVVGVVGMSDGVEHLDNKECGIAERMEGEDGPEKGVFVGWNSDIGNRSPKFIKSADVNEGDLVPILPLFFNTGELISAVARPSANSSTIVFGL